MIDLAKGLEYRNKISEIDEKYLDVTRRFNEEFKIVDGMLIRCHEAQDDIDHVAEEMGEILDEMISVDMVRVKTEEDED